MFGFGDEQRERRLARIERTLVRQDELLRRLAAHAGVETDDLPDEFALTADEKALVDANRSIEAIKAYRERTGAGLAEATRWVRGYQSGRDERPRS
ncbi:hypothetical protein [Agilicoccus flavus]|uniref:hypothetical protein n=1 Tax=Agilicoccus flavus TaxID=2775968 RepID=UPI001CF70E4B|nr:hypothetical protein [Agilicoccus flavus]